MVGGKPLLPGACFLEAAAAAAHLLLPSSFTASAPPYAPTSASSPRAPALKGVLFQQPLVIPAPGSPHMSLAVEVDPVEGRFSVVSQGASSARATTHVTGAYALVTQPSEEGPGWPRASSSSKRKGASLERARAMCPTPHDVAHLYRELRAAGLQYGPTFRGLSQVHKLAQVKIS